MKLDEETLRTILKAAMQLERPTTSAIAEATGICEEGVEKYMRIAEILGLAEFVVAQHSRDGKTALECPISANPPSLAGFSTPRIAVESRDSNDEVLSDDVAEDLLKLLSGQVDQCESLIGVLHEQLDLCESLVEAVHCLRSGVVCYSPSTPESSVAV